jgi:exodeoxyribonuclease VII small subunit
MLGNTELSFESSFARLEEILEKMNSGKLSLEESLKLYEEADRLIAWSNKQLATAEKRIEMLTKNREGELVMNEQGSPALQEFAATSTSPLNRNLKEC